MGVCARAPSLCAFTAVGVGSNDLGLDRGQVSPGAVVQFRRIGPKVLLVEPNFAFRAGSNVPSERLAVQQSFPESVLWRFAVVAEDSAGTVLVDATDLFMRDAHGIAERLTETGQGPYKLDISRRARRGQRTLMHIYGTTDRIRPPSLSMSWPCVPWRVRTALRTG
jgi:Domain of unknown function (DUF5117)